jgi:hypothetical protein
MPTKHLILVYVISISNFTYLGDYGDSIWRGTKKILWRLPPKKIKYYNYTYVKNQIQQMFADI